MKQGIECTVQGRQLTAQEIESVKILMQKNPSWNRTRVSKELCQLWNWRRASGGLKDISCRSLLRKLEQLGYIQLPKGRHKNDFLSRKRSVPAVLHSTTPINGALKDVYPLKFETVEKGYNNQLFKYFISHYHYLGWSGTVGENLKYLIYDAYDRPLGCLMWGAAAWKVKPRDSYIGWDAAVRVRNLSFVVNNNRFLILPWVKIPHLASHILGMVCRRLCNDWQKKYYHPVYMAETFVETSRFKGTCYKAANWVHVGQTQGRGKLDVKNQYLLPIKDIWLYPLDKAFREKLCHLEENRVVQPFKNPGGEHVKMPLSLL